MQIPHSSLAANVAAITSRNVGDKEAKPDPSNVAQQSHVEQSGESNADRDAQGQGDGLPGRRHKKNQQPQEDTQPSHPSDMNAAAPRLPDEPPSQLDLLG